MKSWFTPASSRCKREGRLLFVEFLPQPDITGMVTIVEAVKITSLNRGKVYDLIASGVYRRCASGTTWACTR